MALLAAWMGLPLALLSFGIGVILAAVAGIVLLARPRRTPQESTSAAEPTHGSASVPASPAGARNFSKLPLGTFLCIGGIVAHLWGQRILATYLQMFHF
jgi:leader peptidase (prepilin peptidase)/N-methyltransferase